jgi:isopentenyl-diphosphate delta-isomerase type 1
MDELLIQVDGQDNVIDAIDRLKAHLDEGILHRGLMVVVTNYQNKVLLTQRSLNRPDLDFPPPFPSYWDITIAGHPKWGQTDHVTQMVNELKEELGFTSAGNEINYLGKFQYHAPDPTYPNAKTSSTFKLSEREVCGVGLIRTKERAVLDWTELQASMWVEIKQLPEKLATLKVALWALLMMEKSTELWKE